MHFIEQWLNLSPDNGSGALEMLLFLVPCLAGMCWQMRHPLGAQARAGKGVRRPANLR